MCSLVRRRDRHRVPLGDRSRRGASRDDPRVVYGTSLAIVTPDRLLFENLYPREFLEGNPLVSGRLPADASQLRPARRQNSPSMRSALLPIAGGATLCTRRSGRARWLWSAARSGPGCRSGGVPRRPEALRHGLEFAYGWIPAGAAIAAVVLTWRLWKRTDAPDRPEASRVDRTRCAHRPCGHVVSRLLPPRSLRADRGLRDAVRGDLHGAAPPRNFRANRPTSSRSVRCGSRFSPRRPWPDDQGRATGRGRPCTAREVHSRRRRNEAALYQGALDWIARDDAPRRVDLRRAADARSVHAIRATNPTDQLSALARLVDGRGRGADDRGARGSRTSARDHRRSGVARLRPRRFRRHLRPNPRSLDRTSLRTRCRAALPSWHSFEGNIPPRRLFIWLKRR